MWGLLGTIVGAAASIATAWLAARSSRELERAKSREEQVEQARAFQRHTLLDLQEAVHDVLRLVSRAHHEDLLAHRAGTEWSKIMLSEEVNEGVRVALRRVFILIERVSDESLRASVKHLTGSASDVLYAHSEQEARSRLYKTTNDAWPLFEEIGTVLRRYYEPAPAL